MFLAATWYKTGELSEETQIAMPRRKRHFKFCKNGHPLKRYGRFKNNGKHRESGRARTNEQYGSRVCSLCHQVSLRVLKRRLYMREWRKKHAGTSGISVGNGNNH